MNAPSTLDLAGIRARAEAATSGPWQKHNTSDGIRLLYADHFIDEDGTPAAFPYDICLCDGGKMDEDAAHIAGMDPPTTLTLVDEVERLTRERDEARLGVHERSSAGVATIPRQDLNNMLAEREKMKAEVAKLRARVAELEGENKILAKSILAQEHAGDPCPFASGKLDMDLDKPCPVCGDLGHVGSSTNNCVSRYRAPKVRGETRGGEGS